MEVTIIVGDNWEASEPIVNYFEDKEDVIESVRILNHKSRKFIEKRDANSLLSRYAATAPFLLFYKEGVVVSALYNESVCDGNYKDAINIKLKEAENAIPRHAPVEESFDS